jgi:DNA-binding NtrC family response regulator
MVPRTVRVLIVEDQQLWRDKFFGESLRELGFTVSPASTKEEALELLSKYEFNLAIIDLNLTDVPGNADGLVIVDHIESVAANTPIIIVSGTEGGLHALHERPYRVFAEMQKQSFSLEDFISKVKMALEVHPVNSSHTGS